MNFRTYARLGMLDMGLEPRAEGALGPLALRFAGITELQASYMPYLKRGGLFIATGRRFRLGEPVSANLSLLGHFELLAVHGQIAWITPRGAQGNRAAGIGLHFEPGAPMQAARETLERLLAQHGQATVASYTM